MIAAKLGEQDAVGHQLDHRALGDAAIEARLVADEIAEVRVELARDAIGDAARGEPARLRMADQPACATAEFDAQLRQLRGLARPGFATDADDLMPADRGARSDERRVGEAGGSAWRSRGARCH